MSVTDDLVQNAGAYAAAFDKGHLPMPPAKQVAIVACMDARLKPLRAAGPQRGRRPRDSQRWRSHHR